MRKGDYPRDMRDLLEKKSLENRSTNASTNRVLQWIQQCPIFISVVFLFVVASWPSLGKAAEIRKGDRVEIPASETIEDTLIVFADTVVVEGQIHGDLIAAARVLRITGNITGNLFAAGEQVDLEGQINGNVIGAANTLSVEGTVQHQMYAASSKLILRDESTIRHDLLAAAANIDIAGTVGRDIYGVAGRVALDGSTTRDLVVSTEALQIRKQAKVGRDLRARVSNLEHVEISEGSTVVGQKEITVVENDPNHAAQYTGAFVWRLIMAIGGFILGIVLYTFVPSIFRTLPPPRNFWLRTIGIGFVALIAFPFASIISAATVVGIPLAVATMTVFFWVSWVGMLVVAAEIGRRALRRTSSPNGLNRSEFAWSLGLGLLILVIVTSIPIIGNFAELIASLIGIGALLPYLRQQWMQRAS